jgi:hypothetical protein
MQTPDLNDTIDKVNSQSVPTAGRSVRRLAIVAAGLSVGALVAYLISKTTSLGHDELSGVPDNIVDDRGTRQGKAAGMLRNLRDQAFDASDEKLALALGRPLEDVVAWNAGSEVIDDDVVMKARGIAMHRGVKIE